MGIPWYYYVLLVIKLVVMAYVIREDNKANRDA